MVHLPFVRRRRLWYTRGDGIQGFDLVRLLPTTHTDRASFSGKTWRRADRLHLPGPVRQEVSRSSVTRRAGF